jgi:hypothetical protein
MSSSSFSFPSVLLASILLVSCAPSPTGGVEFPIIGNDPDRLVETMEWSDSEDIPAPGDFEEPLIMPSSTSDLVEIAVKGGGCPPSTQVAVSGSVDAVVIVMNLGGSIEPIGVDCPDVLTTHVLAIRFRNPISLDHLEVSSVRATQP